MFETDDGSVLNFDIGLQVSFLNSTDGSYFVIPITSLTVENNGTCEIMI